MVVRGIDGDFLKSLLDIGDGKSYFPKEGLEMAGIEKSQILSDLSERETEVLTLCKGKSNKEIAEVMFVNTETMKSHVSTIISTFGVKDRTPVVIGSIRAGM